MPVKNHHILPLLIALLVTVNASANDAIREKITKDHPGLIPAEALDRAFAWSAENADRVANKNYLTIIDFTQPSTVKRCHVIDLKTGAVESLLVAHGRKTGGDRAERFSNVVGSNQSSLGIYLTAELYQGKHGLSMRLDGAEPTNSNARKRAIVMHGADYVSEAFIAKNGRLGRSEGCPALEMSVIERIVKQLNGKSVMLIYGKEASPPTTKQVSDASSRRGG